MSTFQISDAPEDDTDTKVIARNLAKKIYLKKQETKKLELQQKIEEGEIYNMGTENSDRDKNQG